MLTISNEVRSLARKELKIRPEGGAKVSGPLAQDQQFPFAVQRPKNREFNNSAFVKL